MLNYALSLAMRLVCMIGSLFASNYYVRCCIIVNYYTQILESPKASVETNESHVQ